MEGRACESAISVLPKRRSLPHHAAVSQPNQSIIVFVTLCSKNRRKLFANESAHGLVVESWRRAQEWLVGRYVLMPDHLHLFCEPASFDAIELKKWVYKWRGRVSRNWPIPGDKPIWQKDFFDRQLRAGDSYSEKWEYVRDNPVRAGLVSSSDDWLFQGEVNELEWHDAA